MVIPGGNALDKFLNAIDEGYEAALAEAQANVERLTTELQEARATLATVQAYKAIRDGKVPLDLLGDPVTAPHNNGARAARGEVATRVAEVIKAHTDGLNRGQIIEIMGGKGDKKAESSISNALNGLKKNGAVGYRDGLYLPAYTNGH